MPLQLQHKVSCGKKLTFRNGHEVLCVPPLLGYNPFAGLQPQHEERWPVHRSPFRLPARTGTRDEFTEHVTENSFLNNYLFIF